VLPTARALNLKGSLFWDQVWLHHLDPNTKAGLLLSGQLDVINLLHKRSLREEGPCSVQIPGMIRDSLDANPDTVWHSGRPYIGLPSPWQEPKVDPSNLEGLWRRQRMLSGVSVRETDQEGGPHDHRNSEEPCFMA
jgi:hypothetical protein